MWDNLKRHLKPIQDVGERGKKAPPLSVFPLLLPQNIEISPQNFMTFSFNPFAILVSNFKSVPSASP